MGPAKDPSARELAGAPPAAVEDRALDLTAAELEWLLEIGTTVEEADAGARGEARIEQQLRHLLSSSVEHLACVCCALLVPERYLRLTERSRQESELHPENLIAELEQPVLSRVRQQSEPMLVHRARAGSSPPVRLLAVPVTIGGSESPGALLFVRSVAAPRFTRMHLALARHVSRSISAELQSDLDLVSGLHTRRSLRRLLEQRRSAERTSDGAHAIVSVKIDRLDAINKTGGFEAGDSVIAGVVGLLKSEQLRSGGLAARISGNEFAMVLPNTGPEQAQGTAERLQRLSVSLGAIVAGGQEPIALSCGIASFESASEFESGLALAQLACRTARRRGAGRIEVYHDTDVSMIQRQTDIVAVQLLRRALREDRLTLFGQRIVPLQELAAYGGYEVLLRSLDDDPAENRAPQSLLSAAHRNHLATAVDLWVVEHALAQAAPYGAALKEAAVSLSINITGPSLTDQKFLERTRRLIEQSGIEPELITFEITETVAVLSLARAVAFVREVRELGCRFALDDFGTGVNSLKNLTSLPVDRVKIDGSFVADLLTNRQSDSMVRAIVNLARDLGISTVAEYAESTQIIERLRELGVEYAQGYAVERPRPLADVLRDARGHSSRRGVVLANR